MRLGEAAFEVEEFEYVDAEPDVALVRLSGTWPNGAPDGDVELVAWLSGERTPLSPLPAPPRGDGRPWHAAYSAPSQLLSDPATAFELVPEDGVAIVLPQPLPHGIRPTPPAPAGPDPAALEAERPRIFTRRRPTLPGRESAELRAAVRREREARQAAEREASEERARAQRAEAVLADELRRTVGKTEELLERIDDYEHGRVSFEHEIEAVRRTHADLLAEAREEHALELHGLRQELDAAREGLEAANEHVDTLHEAHSLELGAARSQRDAAERRVHLLEEQLADLRSALETVRDHVDDRDQLIEHAREEAAAAAQESAELEAAVGRLRDLIAARARQEEPTGRRFGRGETIDRSREELRRDAERIAALERQAEALRDAIHSQLPYSLHASPLQEALPLEGEEE